MEYDLFISHASEDKDDFVRPLAKRLEDAGYEVWYDEMTLTLGDSLSKKINEGLASSRYGIVVLSHNFFGKEWPEWELQGLTSRHISNKVILPIWHNIEKVDLLKYNPSLADMLAVSSSEGINEVVKKIHGVIKPSSTKRSKLLSEAKKHLSDGHYETAIIVAGKRLQKYLREHALNTLGREYFEQYDEAIENYSIHRLMKLMQSKQLIVTKNQAYTFELADFSKYRNIAVHGSSDVKLTRSVAKRYINNVSEFILVNSNRAKI